MNNTIRHLPNGDFEVIDRETALKVLIDDPVTHEGLRRVLQAELEALMGTQAR